MKSSVAFGFIRSSGRPVVLGVKHMVISGITQGSGKTTLVRALALRSGARVVVFETKPFAKDWLPHGKQVPVLMHGTLDEVTLKELLEAEGQFGMKAEFPILIRSCDGAKDMYEVMARIRGRLYPPPPPPGEKPPKTDRHEKNALLILETLLKRILDQMQSIETSNKLEIKKGLNVIDISGLTEEAQQVAVKAVSDYLYERETNVIMVLDEAQKFVPENRRSAARHSVVRLIKEGGARKIWVWVASQALTAVSKEILKQTENYILGRQREFNECNRVLAQLPLPDQLKPSADTIQHLNLGYWLVAAGDAPVVEAYAWPTWCSAGTAKTAAMLGTTVPPEGFKTPPAKST